MSEDANVYDIGDEVIIMADFADRSGNPGNPTVVTAEVEDPAGTVTTPTPGAPNPTGHYEAVVIPDKPGDWYYRWRGTQGLRAAGEKLFRVRGSRFN